LIIMCIYMNASRLRSNFACFDVQDRLRLYIRPYCSR